VNTVHRLSFSRFGELDLSTRTAFITELHETMDEPFSNSSTATELLESFEHKLAYWVLMADKTAVGLFALSLSITFPQRYQTTSFILKNWRGNRLGPLVKIAVAQSFLEKQVPLITCVRDGNLPSIRSLQRTFPELTSEKKLSATKNMHGESYYLHVFNLSMVNSREVPREARSLTETMNSWLEQQNVSFLGNELAL